MYFKSFVEPGREKQRSYRAANFWARTAPNFEKNTGFVRQNATSIAIANKNKSTSQQY